MAHEHTGNCCKPHEHESHHLEHAHHVGQLCMQGACTHVEHRGPQVHHMMAAQLESARFETTKNTATELPETKKKKTAKKRASLSLSQLLLATN